MFNIDFKNSNGSSKRKTKEGCDLVETICNITQRELSLMQSQISTAIHGVFSRHKKIPDVRFSTPAVCSLRSTRIAVTNKEVKEFDRKERCNLKNKRDNDDNINDANGVMDDSYHSNFFDFKQRKELRERSTTETIQTRKNEVGQRCKDLNDDLNNIEKENENEKEEDDSYSERDCFHRESSDRIRGEMIVGRKLDL